MSDLQSCGGDMSLVPRGQQVGASTNADPMPSEEGPQLLSPGQVTARPASLPVSCARSRLPQASPDREASPCLLGEMLGKRAVLVSFVVPVTKRPARSNLRAGKVYLGLTVSWSQSVGGQLRGSRPKVRQNRSVVEGRGSGPPLRSGKNICPKGTAPVTHLPQPQPTCPQFPPSSSTPEDQRTS